MAGSFISLYRYVLKKKGKRIRVIKQLYSNAIESIHTRKQITKYSYFAVKARFKWFQNK